jgi:signal transduction histidine kinase
MGYETPDLRVRIRKALPDEEKSFFSESARIRALEDLAEREREQRERRKRIEEEDQTVPGLRVLHG